MSSALLSIAKSWRCTDSAVTPTAELLRWVEARRAGTEVSIRRCGLEDCEAWAYDPGQGAIRHESGGFFSVTGCRGQGVSQPMLLQPEIGYLGFLCREFDGVMHFLVQAKIEPGNINTVQLSPTLQATRSNFTRRHGGNAPAYLDYFLDAEHYEIVVDQLQTEQGTRFFQKRNRNIVLHVREDVQLLPSHRWVTLGQLKQLMRLDNLVNMDTRSVLSCLPFPRLTPDGELESLFSDGALFRSMFGPGDRDELARAEQYLRGHRTPAEARPALVPLNQLPNWEYRDGALACTGPAPFRVIFCHISIEGREVRRWSQPLVEALGVSTLGLICCEDDGVLKFLVRARTEPGCLDGVTLGPTVQLEPETDRPADSITRFFLERLARGQGVMFDHLLSEEGGRFYHEQNRNVLLRVSRSALPALPEDCFLLDFRALCALGETCGVLNIQLRDLLSLLEA